MRSPRITRMDTNAERTKGLTYNRGAMIIAGTSLLFVSTAGREPGSSEPASASFGTGREYENFQLTNRGREAYVLASSSLSASAAGRGAASKEAAPAHFHGAAGPEPD
jgi:hypothetical protein